MYAFLPSAHFFHVFHTHGILVDYLLLIGIATVYSVEYYACFGSGGKGKFPSRFLKLYIGPPTKPKLT